MPTDATDYSLLICVVHMRLVFAVICRHYKLEVIERVRRYLRESGVMYVELRGTRVERFVSTESRLNSLALEPWRLDTAVSSCQRTDIALICVVHMRLVFAVIS